MIRYSYFSGQVKLLREAYGPDNIKVNKGNTLILIRDFKLPLKYGTESTSVLVEVPDGFGYGMDILNTFILLERKSCKEHLFECKDLTKLVAEQFPVPEKTKAPKNSGWFWICLHLWGSQSYDLAKAAHTSGKRGKPGLEDDISIQEASLTGLAEHLKIIRCVLKSLSDKDQATLAEIKRMNRDREKTEQDMKKLIDSFVFDNNWRVMRWMH